MNFSEDKQNHLAHVIVDGLWKDDLVDYTDEDQALREAKKAIAEYVRREVGIDEAVTKKIATLKKGVYEGTREYDLLYKKYYDEEQAKQGR